MSQKKISIVIPTYNGGMKIIDCINSLLKQNYSNYEIIVVNDGSTDDTLNILKSNFGSNKKIKIYSQNNGGPAKARNLGIKKSSGIIIGFTDDDCIPQGGWILNAVKDRKSY